MNESVYVLGIDLGTGGARVGIFDVKGRAIVFCSEKYALYTPSSGRAEQNPDEWWSALCKASKRAIEKSKINPSDIKGIGVDTTYSTVLLLGDDMVPLRNAIMWMDVRASKQAKQITKSCHDALKYNGFCDVSAEWMPPKALWIKENEPEIWNKATRFYDCIDYITYKLTNEYTASMNGATIRWYYNSEEGGYPVDFYNKIGLGDLIEKLPKRVLAMGELVGGLTEKAAKELGLKAGIPVAEGGADAFVGIIGLNAYREGKVALITGSSNLVVANVEKSTHIKGIWGAYPDCLVKGLYALEGGQVSTGSIVEWLIKNFCSDLKIKASEKGKSVYEYLEEEATKLPVGAEGVLALDFFQGNRTPHVDPDVRGMFYGLSLSHTPVHLYRAIIESICFGTQALIEIFKKSGFNPSAMIISGGATNSKFWMQTHADVSNLPIIVPKETEAPCLGSAILGAVAGGVYKDIDTATLNMTSVDYVIYPNEKRHEEYKFYFEKYKEFYAINKKWMNEVTEHALKED